ncbi:epithelial cell adhesion molecule [Megalops cyprinoides]|uniref:epithelial cell adhesion molecule n=1 Tax=Megalops cyprinoides TaxID=118141 RepID=UPI001863E6E7|nr:epithelial cell adhesion molecule [Megalops cyprinoides]
MKSVVLLLVVAFAAAASAQCTCKNMKWATCDGTPCQCSVMVGDGQSQVLDCEKLVPKCFLMKAEMYRAKKGLSTRTGGKPTEHAFVDNDGIYDPDCETTGVFKAKQCNNTEECWCVNSAGVRRTDKGDKNLKCEKLVETYWVRLELKHKPITGQLDKTKLKTGMENTMLERYGLPKNFVASVDYDKDGRLIVVDVKKDKNDKTQDLSRMAYYMEKDVKVLPLFQNPAKFEPSVEGQKLEMENILVYYVDAEPPTFTMKRLTGGVIAVIVVVSLAVIAGLLVLFFARRREQARYQKTQVRELDEMQKSLS